MKSPLFSFFGAKWRAAPHYPKPRDVIIEPFAGSACYSCRYPDRRVILVERDPLIAALWRWLIRVSPDEVRALPDVTADTCTDDYEACDEARWLLGFTMNGGVGSPRKRFSARHRNPPFPRLGASRWWARQREATAQGVAEIKHWTIVESDYLHAPLIEGATYFVDPPYEQAGSAYRYHDLRYDIVAEACRIWATLGPVIACEALGASWLPFVPFRDVKASSRGGARVSREVVWLS